MGVYNTSRKENCHMIVFTERVGAEPQVIPSVETVTTEDKPEDKKKKQKKEDTDGDTAFDQAPEHEENRADKKDVQH